jgi:hypothetical protein
MKSCQPTCLRFSTRKSLTAEDDRSMSLTELRLALGVTEALLNEALYSPSLETSGSRIRPRVAWRWAPTGESDAGSRRQPEVSRATASA